MTDRPLLGLIEKSCFATRWVKRLILAIIYNPPRKNWRNIPTDGPTGGHTLLQLFATENHDSPSRRMKSFSDPSFPIVYLKFCFLNSFFHFQVNVRSTTTGCSRGNFLFSRANHRNPQILEMGVSLHLCFRAEA